MGNDFMTAKLMVAIFAYDRPELLGPCLQTAREEQDENTEVHVWVDDSGRDSEVDRLVDESGFIVHRPKERMPQFYSGPALQLFLEDAERGELLMLSDSDMIYGPGAFVAVREHLTFWWRQGLPLGMLSAGVRIGNFRFAVHERAGRRLLRRRGTEACCTLVREALEKVVLMRGRLPNTTAQIKNGVNLVHHERALPLDPPLPIAHIGVLGSSRNNHELYGKFFLGPDKKPLNPRPELFDVEKALETVRR